MPSYRLKCEKLTEILDDTKIDQDVLVLQCDFAERTFRRQLQAEAGGAKAGLLGKNAENLVATLRELVIKAEAKPNVIEKVTLENLFERVAVKEKDWWKWDLIKRGPEELFKYLQKHGYNDDGRPLNAGEEDRWSSAFLLMIDDHVGQRGAGLQSPDDAKERAVKYLGRSPDELAQLVAAARACNPNSVWINPHRSNSTLDLATGILPLTDVGEELLLGGDADEVAILRGQSHCPQADKFLITVFAGDTRQPSLFQKGIASAKLGHMAWQQIGRMSCDLEETDMRVYSFATCPSQGARFETFGFKPTGHHFCRSSFNYPIVCVELSSAAARRSPAVFALRLLMSGYRERGRQSRDTNVASESDICWQNIKDGKTPELYHWQLQERKD